MRTKLNYVISILIVTILIISGLTVAISANNANKEFKIFKPSKSFIDEDDIEDMIVSRGVYKRVIADDVGEDDINLFKNKGCLVKHKLKHSASFECPEEVVSKLKVREARVFHILDLEADEQIKADQVWAEGIDGEGVNVVILDTGIDSSHIELSDSVLGCMNFVAGETCEDFNGHGTHVAGIITANGVYKNIDGSNDATGVAPGAGIYMLKVCGSDGYCWEDDMEAAMEYAVNNLVDAKIMSISIGGGNFGSHCDSDPLAAKVNWVVNNGFTVVIAAGNEGSGVSSPACASGAIAVGAVDKSNIVSYWSNRGTALDIVAPGVDILSTYSCLAAGDCDSYWYAYMSGTSMSAPHVSGVVALLLQTKPSATIDEIKDSMYTTADPAAGCQECRFIWRERCYRPSIVACTAEDEGAGVVDAYGAYNYIKSLAPECTVNADCDDGLYCNGFETCQAGVCQAGTSVDCSGLNDQCNVGVCDEVMDSCVKEPANEGLTCEDGLFCNVGETCLSGECTGGSAKDCSDANECTTDSCDEAVNSCVSTPVADGTLCDDGQFCTLNDVCTSGLCGGTQRDCSDSVSCTDDSCNEALDVCEHTPNDAYCDNGLFCDGAEICDASVGCQAGVPVNCDDNNECTVDSCNEAIDACEYTNVADNTACTGGICCSGTCSVAICSADIDCDDNNACTIDTCNYPGTCSASCSYADVTACVNDDGCCPAVCDHTTDNDCPAIATMHVGDITFDADVRTWRRYGSWCRVTTVVPILDASGSGVKEAEVYGTWSGAYNEDVSESTNGEGKASFRTSWVRGCGTFTFTVNDVTKTDWTYDPSANIETSDSITLP